VRMIGAKRCFVAVARPAEIGRNLPDRFRTEQARSRHQPEVPANIKDNGSGHASVDSL